MDLVKLLNTVRANASQTYQDRIPLATKNNLDQLSASMANYTSTQNEFLSLLINRIAMVIVNSKTITNPLAQLKKGAMPMGKDIEEIFTNPAVSKEYNASSTELLAKAPPDVKALYYGVNRKDKYPVTIEQPTLSMAFTSEYEMNRLVNDIVNSLYSGDNYDEFLLMKGLVADAFDKDYVIKKDFTWDLATMTKENATDFIKELRADSLLMTFAGSNYNSYTKIKPAGDKGRDCITFTPQSDQILLIDSRVYSNVNVDVLASAFNMDKTDFVGRVIPVDNFNGKPILAMLCDVAWFKVYDNYKTIKYMDNGDTLTYKYWLHHWQVLAYSMFANALVYTYKPTVTP